MMYDNKLAVAVKSNGKVLREFKDQVYLPFGSEYSFLIKNLNTKRAVVKIEIDGRDVTGGGVVVNANSSLDLERFIENLDKGSKFKFIERTASIEKHRGVGVEDGLVRIEFEFEQPRAVQSIWGGLGQAINNHSTFTGSTGNVDAISKSWLDNTSYDPRSIQQDYFFAQTAAGRGIGGMSGDMGDLFNNVTVSASASAGPSIMKNCGETMSMSMAAPKNEAGITVEGSQSDQRFVNVHINTDGVKHVIVMKMLGETEQGVQVQAPITVKHKAECKYCGKGNTHNSKFCTECGSSLQIF